MKKTLLFYIITLILCLSYGCQNTGKSVCHIKGTVSEKYNGKRIFLVPFNDSRSVVVDSVVITDGKFEFESDTVMLAKILLDYHFRMGTEPLLVIVEPGVVNVTIDSISSAGGTAQNDSLQQWKERKMTNNSQMIQLTAEIKRLKEHGFQQDAELLIHNKDSINLAFKNYTRQLAKNMGSGILYDFLNPMYPKTYRRKMPDGTMITIDADTNEQIDK